MISTRKRHLDALIDEQRKMQLSETYNGRRHAKRARVCAIAITINSTVILTLILALFEQPEQSND